MLTVFSTNNLVLGRISTKNRFVKQISQNELQNHFHHISNWSFCCSFLLFVQYLQWMPKSHHKRPLSKVKCCHDLPKNNAYPVLLRKIQTMRGTHRMYSNVPQRFPVILLISLWFFWFLHIFTSFCSKKTFPKTFITWFCHIFVLKFQIKTSKICFPCLFRIKIQVCNQVCKLLLAFAILFSLKAWDFKIHQLHDYVAFQSLKNNMHMIHTVWNIL